LELDWGLDSASVLAFDRRFDSGSGSDSASDLAFDRRLGSDSDSDSDSVLESASPAYRYYSSR
jgi:hypothetical protein